MSHFKVLLLNEGFFVFEGVSGQKSVLSGYSPMSVPPPKRGKFIFDHTELFVYKFYINRKETFFPVVNNFIYVLLPISLNIAIIAT